MGRSWIFDTGPLGKIAHPKANRRLTAWITRVLGAGDTVILPEIADYELRRELIRANLSQSLNRLDQLKQTLVYQPLDTATMSRAASLWALARNEGHPTADDKALDGDVILAAQAEAAGATVVTENVSHLDRFVAAADWETLF